MSDASRRHNAITRRSFLASSAIVAAGVAGAAIAGCGDKKSRTSSTPAPSPTPAAERVTVGTRGGVLRAYNLDALTYDSLDPHLTQMGPIVDVHSAIYSRLLRYADERTRQIVPDLAATMPEQPDATTYIIRLRSGATWHDTPKFRAAHTRAPGRAVDAEDVKYSIERQSNKNSPNAKRFFRSSDWDVIDKITVTDPATLTITTKRPVAPFLSMLAGRHAFIVAKEVAGRDDVLGTDADAIGSGPFMLNTFQDGVVAGLARNPAWFARDDNPDGIGTGRPFVDGYEAYFTPESDPFQRAAFERHIVDITGFVDPAALDTERKTNLDAVNLEETDAGGVLSMRLLVDRGVFKDDRARRALHLAIDRPALVDLLYPPIDGRPSARLSGPIAPVASDLALDPGDLQRRPGYRTGTARADDVQTARQLWQAAAGTVASTEIHVSIAGRPGPLGAILGPALKRQVEDVLGPGVTVTVQTDPSGYALIASGLVRNLEGATDGVVTCTLMIEDGGIDLDDWLLKQYRSGASMNTYRVQDPQLDSLLDRSRAEFDSDARVKLGRDAQDYLLSNVNARLDICAPVERRLVWGYVRNSRMPVWYGSTQDLADVWIDTAHPAYRPRPT